MSRDIARLAAAFLVMSALIMPAQAAPGRSARGKGLAACKADIAKFCEDAQADGGAIGCLKANSAGLSKGCKAGLASMERKMKPRAPGMQACNSDIKKLCPGFSSAQAMECLAEKGDAVSEGCRARLNRARNKRGTGLEACKADIASFCADAEGDVVGCLKDNKDDLSGPCKRAISSPRGGKGGPFGGGRRAESGEEDGQDGEEGGPGGEGGDDGPPSEN